jgi:hypothetical protein
VSNVWRGGSTRAWRRQREQILIRDGYACRLRIAGVCTKQATCVHHTRGKGVSGDDPAHMVSACGPCNLRVGNPAADTQGRRLVVWVRAQGRPVRLMVAMREFPDTNVGQVLARAVGRGELVRADRGYYAAGPIEPQPIANDPQPKPMTKW